MKVCSVCNNEHPIEEFAWKNVTKGVRHSQCGECRKAGAKRSYEKHKDARIQKVLLRNAQRREEYKDWKSQYSCVVCSEDDQSCLDFHHLDPTEKDFVLSDWYNNGSAKTEAEMKKCVCLCANCHRKVHAGKISLLSSNPS